MRRAVTLGISVGTLSMGLAVFKGTELVHWRVKTFKGKWNKKKMEMVVSRVAKYVKRYEVAYVALKVPHRSRSSRSLNKLIDAINEFAKEDGIKINSFTIEEIEKKFCPKGMRRNKQLLIEYTLAVYPYVTPEYNREKRSKNPYYLKLFEAILAAKLYTERWCK